jgi:hypothetical protein
LSSQPIILNVAGGTIPDEALYIGRPEDDEVHDLLSQGIYCNVLSSRQMGKSSLMYRVRRRLEAAGVRVLRVDLSPLGGSSLGDRNVNPGVAWHNALIKKLAATVTETARADSPPLPQAQAWLRGRPNEPMGARFRAFVDDFLLVSADRWVVIFDEVDVTRGLAFTDELFLCIRSMADERAAHPALKRVTFCMVGVFAADDLIKSTTTTPYNVGRTVRLLDFSRERCDMTELERYLDGNGLDGRGTLDDVLAWTSGQPFLTITLCDRAVKGRANGDGGVDGFVREELGNPTALRVHFDRMELVVRERIAKSSTMRARYLRMLWGIPIKAHNDRDETTFLLAGLIRRTKRGKLQTRNRIYRRRFDRNWVEAILPAPPVPRALRFVLGALATIVVVASIVLVVAWRRRVADDAQRAEQDRQIEDMRGRLREATSDDDATAQWGAARVLRLPQARVRAAAEEYWTRRVGELTSLADTLTAGGCFEEAYVVRAFAAARRAAPGPPAWKPSVAGNLWLSDVAPGATELERCRGRRRITCDRVVQSASGVTASCDTDIVSFAPHKPATAVKSEGRLRVLLESEKPWSIGIADAPGYVVITHDNHVVQAAACPAQPMLPTKQLPVVKDVLVRNALGTALAYLCQDGTYAEESIYDLPQWLARMEESKRLSRAEKPPGGYLASALAWRGPLLAAASFGPKGELFEGVATRTRRLSLPNLSAIGSFDERTYDVAFGTESNGGTGDLGTAILADPPSVVDRWPLVNACRDSACIVVAVSGGRNRKSVAGLVIRLDDSGHASTAWLALVDDGTLEEHELDDLRASDVHTVAMAVWDDKPVAALPTPGRIRLYAPKPVQTESWADVQARIGLTLVLTKDPRLERLQERGMQPARSFEEVFPPW